MSNDKKVYIGRLPGNQFVVFRSSETFDEKVNPNTAIRMEFPLMLQVQPDRANPQQLNIGFSPFLAFTEETDAVIPLDKFSNYPTLAEGELASTYNQQVTQLSTGLLIPPERKPVAAALDLSGTRPPRR